jgi:hypothetical protein
MYFIVSLLSLRPSAGVHENVGAERGRSTSRRRFFDPGADFSSREARSGEEFRPAAAR